MTSDSSNIKDDFERAIQRLRQNLPWNDDPDGYEIISYQDYCELFGDPFIDREERDDMHKVRPMLAARRPIEVTKKDRPAKGCDAHNRKLLKERTRVPVTAETRPESRAARRRSNRR